MWASSKAVAESRVMTRALCILLLLAATAIGDGRRDVELPPPGLTTELASYIGVATSAATPTLREQLGLSRGTGVVVELIEPKSPAEAAGLQTHDVIVRMDDQLVVNVQQLSVLVRLQKPGTPLSLHVLRHGEPLEIKVLPAQRDLPLLDEMRPGLPPMILPRPGVGRSCSIVTHTDGNDVITLVTREDDRHVTVKDLQGNLLFDGSLNTSDDELKVPASLREKLHRVMANSDQFKELMARPN